MPGGRMMPMPEDARKSRRTFSTGGLRALAGALCLIALGSCGGASSPVAKITVSAAGSGRPAAGYPGLGLLVEPLAPLGEADAGGEMTISLR
ncbi:MAG: hypothetical protein GY835_03065, partial [bacterium]|nr:hypothetical protein [bacterium]